MIYLCRCCAWFVSLHNVLRSFKWHMAQFANFWPKADPNPNPSQVMQCILQIAQTHRLHATQALSKVISVKSSRWLASVKMYMRRPVEFISPTLLLLVCICVSVCVSVCGWNANGDCCGRQSAVHAPDECFIGDTPWRNWSWRITVNTGWHCVFVAVTRPIYPHQFLSSRVSPWLCAPELVVIFVSKTFDILEKLMYIYSVSQKNTPDIFSCNLNKYFPISITFGTSIT